MGGQQTGLGSHVRLLRELPVHVALHVRHGLKEEEDCAAGLELLLMFVDECHAPPRDLHMRLLELLEEAAPPVAVQVFNALRQIQRYHSCGSHKLLWSPVGEGTRADWMRFLGHVRLLQGPRAFNALLLTQYYLLVLEESLILNEAHPDECLLAKLMQASGNREDARRALVEVLFDVLAGRTDGTAESDGEESSDVEMVEAGAMVDGGEEGDSYLVAQRLLLLVVRLEGMYSLLAPVMSGFSALRSLEEKERFLQTLSLPAEKALLLERLLLRDFRHSDSRKAKLLKSAQGPLDVGRLVLYLELEPKAISKETRDASKAVRTAATEYLVVAVSHLVQAFLLQHAVLSEAEHAQLRPAVLRFCKRRALVCRDVGQLRCHFLLAFVDRVPVDASA